MPTSFTRLHIVDIYIYCTPRLDDLPAAAGIALRMAERGADDEDGFPEVRAGLAHGPVVSRLGDVFGGTVNLR